MRKIEDYRINALAFNKHPWRIDWLGAVTFAERYRRPSQPLIEVQLSCSSDETTEASNQIDGLSEVKQTRQVRVPVAFLPMICIGDVWADGHKIESSSSTVSHFPKLTINKSTACIIKAGLNADDEGNYFLPREQHPFHMRHTQSYCVLVDYGESKIVVPASELIRFYFGSSGDLIAKLFDAPFDSTKIWSNAIQPERGKNAKIDLAPGISGRSATTVARIAFSRTARHSAEIIGKSCIAATANNERAYPKALFPFEGETDLVATGQWLPLQGNERGVFLIFRLISCSHPFPFQGLEYTGERKGTSNRTTNINDGVGNSGSCITRFSRKMKEPKSIVDAEPHKRKASRDLSGDPLKRQQFPDLDGKKVAKIDIDSGAKLIMTTSEASHIVGASVGDAGTDSLISPVDIVAAEAVLDIASNGIANNAGPIVDIFLKLVGSLLSERRFTSVDIVRLDRRQRHDYLCTLPLIMDEDGVIHPWCQIESNGKDRNRKISIARAQEFYATHYIFLPELKTDESKPAQLELHIISDRSRSIFREADLLAALGTHLLQATVPGVGTKLREGVISAQYNLLLPLIPENYPSTIAEVHQLFMTFTSSETNESPTATNQRDETDTHQA